MSDSLQIGSTRSTDNRVEITAGQHLFQTMDMVDKLRSNRSTLNHLYQTPQSQLGAKEERIVRNLERETMEIRNALVHG